MSNPLIALLYGLLAAAGTGRRVPSDSDAATLIPKDSDFSWFFVNHRASFDSQFTLYFNQVKDRWDRASLLGLIALLEKNIVANEAASKTEMKTSTVKSIGDDLKGLKEIEMNTYRISLRNVSQAIDLVKNDAQYAINLFSAESVTLEYLDELRDLDDILIRILSAKEAATAAGVPLAEILALYRTEGNLVAVQPHQRLSGALPALGDGIEDSSLDSLQGTISNLFRLVYLTDPSRSTATDKKKAFQIDALFYWLIQIAGLDIVAHRLRDEGGDPLDVLAKWSKEHWDHKGTATVTPASRKAAWQNIADDFEVEWVERDVSGQLLVHPFPSSGAKPATGTPTYVRVVPKDPEQLIAAALCEAALFIRMIGAADVFLFGVNSNGLAVNHSPPKWIMPARLTYAIYNLYISGPATSYPYGGDFPWAFVISALSNAHRSKKDIYKPLVEEIDNDVTIFKDDNGIDILFGDIMKNIHCKVSGVRCKKPAKKQNDVTLIPGEFKQYIQTWFADPARGKIRIELVAHFIETADSIDWRSWNKYKSSPRANADRYHLHLDYYQHVTEETLDF